MKFDRNAARQQLIKRTEEGYRRKDGDTNLKYLRADINFELWSPRPTKDTPHLFDIIPFIAGPNYPLLDVRNPVRKGDICYVLEIYAHSNIGPGKEWFVCPARNFHKPCPICEDIEAQIAAGADSDQFLPIGAKRRCVYNVLVYSNDEEKKGIQIWEASHKYSEKPILLQAKSPRTGGIDPFADPDVGKSISFEVKGDKYRTIEGHKLVPRDYKISDATLEKAYQLDSLYVLKTYNEILEVYNSEEAPPEAGAEETTTAAPSGRTRQIPKTEEQAAEEPAGEKAAEEEQTQGGGDDNPCPCGGKFGIEIDQLENCGGCEKYNDCGAEADKIAEQKKAERLAKQQKKDPPAGQAAGAGASGGGAAPNRVLRRRPAAS